MVAPSAQAGSDPWVLLVGNYQGIPGGYTTIGAALASAWPGGWILVGPGDYKAAPYGRPPSIALAATYQPLVTANPVSSDVARLGPRSPSPQGAGVAMPAYDSIQFPGVRITSPPSTGRAARFPACSRLPVHR